MSKRHIHDVDKIFLWLAALLAVVGVFIFASASLGLHVREGVAYSRIAFNQIFFGLILGSIIAYVTSLIHYKFLHRYAFYIFIFTLLLTLSVFIPGLGFSHGGATRWMDLGPFSFQPAELLKIGFVIYFAAFLTNERKYLDKWKEGLLPLGMILSVLAVVFLLQKDTDSLLVAIIAALGMFIVAGGKWRHVGALAFGGAAGLGVIALIRPYIRERLLTFLNPAADPLGAGYQIQQSLIAIGSGEVSGRGMGQSIQKFNFLPEPIGDSIFAVFAEEWGFIGTSILVLLFLFFALRGFKIASKAPDMFSQLVITGIIMLIVVQSFMNIAAMLGIFPLAGLPLIFVSQGGSALLIALMSVGIILGISRYQK